MTELPTATTAASGHAPLIIDIAGTRLSDIDRQRLAHPLVGGLILFTRNTTSRAQLQALCGQIKAVRSDLLICIDHEGGRVQRMKTDGFTHLPPLRALGQLWDSDARHGAAQAMNTATAAGYVLGAELRACGVDFSFTPVLDLDYGHSSVIGDRALSRDPRTVSALALALVHGLLQAGMAHCGKHFPGHGFVQGDSHTDIPIDPRSLEAILADDAAPYGWLSHSLTSVMPAHVIYPQVDSRPAGFSARWLHTILRGQLGFEGAIFSDDLSMQGARLIDGVSVSYTEAALVALQAGCDLVLLCNQSLGPGQAVDELIDGLAQAQAQGRWQPSHASRVRRWALLPTTACPTWSQLMEQPAYRQALATLSALATLATVEAPRSIDL